MNDDNGSPAYGVRSNLTSNVPAGGNGGRSLSPNSGSIPFVAAVSTPIANPLLEPIESLAVNCISSAA